jgi:hypothetical protein
MSGHEQHSLIAIKPSAALADLRRGTVALKIVAPAANIIIQ